MSFVEEIVKEDPNKYNSLIKSELLKKLLDMKINQYNALQSEYNKLIRDNMAEGGFWRHIPNKSYMYGLVELKQSNDDWKYLGQSDDLDNCKLKAVQDKKNIYSRVVYTTGNGEYDKTCYGGIKGGKTNPTVVKGITTSLAPNGISRLGGVEGEKLLKQMKDKTNEIEEIIKEEQQNNIGLARTNNLLLSERKITGNKMEQLLDKLNDDRIKINKLIKQPIENASAEDGYKTQISNYIIYFWWIFIVIISIGLSINLINSESVSVITYIFVAIWVVILVKLYYKVVSYYVGWVLEYISIFMTD